MPLFPPQSTIADEYRVVRQLGAGGMAVVYLCQDRARDQQVAVKVMSDRLRLAPDAMARFVREARTLERLDHSNVMPVLRVVQRDDVVAMVMPYYPGESLADRLDRSPGQALDEGEALGIFEQLLAGVRAAHESEPSVIHRDIKPENVYLVDTGASLRVLLMDFGIAKVLKQDGIRTRTGATMGTMAYVAPEQILTPKDVGPAADIFSLGVLLYEMLCGRRPFVSASDLLLPSVVVTAPVPTEPLADLCPGLRALVLRCLEKDPAARYAAVSELASALVDVRSTASVCLHCCRAKGRAGGCEVCGPEAPGRSVDNGWGTLEAGTTLDGGRYVVGRVLRSRKEAQDEEDGNTYLGLDRSDGTRVVVRDCMPWFAERGDGEVGGDLPWRGRCFPTAPADPFQEVRRRFFDEGRRLEERRPATPHLPPCRVFEQKRTAYLVTPYIEGESLEERLLREGGRLAEPLVRSIGVAVCSALAALHAAGSLHLDVRPANVILAATGPTLVGFSPARLVYPKVRGPHAIMRTRWPPPEVGTMAAGDDHRGAWSDVYGLAQTLYEALTGKTCVVPSSSPAQATLGQVSGALSDVLMKALAWDSMQRFQTASDFGSAIRASARAPNRPVARATAASLCLECLRPLRGEGCCTGKHLPRPSIADSSLSGVALPPGTELSGGRYVVGTVVESDTFRTLYRARYMGPRDWVADPLVQIEEVSCRCLESRGSDGRSVEVAPAVSAFFDRYRRRLRRLAHVFAEFPLAVSPLDVFEESGSLYLASGLRVDTSLADLLDTGSRRLPEAQATRVAIDVAKELVTLEDRGYLHRGVKPACIGLAEDGSAHLLSFQSAGLWRGAGADDLSRARTQGYSPPEQGQRTPSRPWAREGPWTDVFSLAVTLYEMLAGELPYGLDERYPRHAPSPHEATRGAVSGAVSDVVMKGIELGPGNRYQWVAVFLKALRSVQQSEGEGVSRGSSRLYVRCQRDQHLYDPEAYSMCPYCVREDLSETRD